MADTRRLWALATQASGDEAFGIRVASHLRANTFHALGLSLTASPSLHDAFQRLLRYSRIVSDAGELSYQLAGHQGQFSLRIPEGLDIAPESIDAFMSCIVRMCRSLAKPHAAEPASLSLRRTRPTSASAQAQFEQAFRCPITYGCSENVLRFDRSVLEAPLRDGDSHLARHHDTLLVKMLAEIDRDRLPDRIRALLVELLPQGGVTQDLIASRLGLSLRTLQRRLQTEKVSYSGILDEARLAVA